MNDSEFKMFEESNMFRLSITKRRKGKVVS